MFRRHGISRQTIFLIRDRTRAFATSTIPAAPCRTIPSAKETSPDDAIKAEGLPKSQPKKAAKNGKDQAPLVGLLAKQARLDQSLKRRTAYYKGKAARDAAKAAGIEPESKPESAPESNGSMAELLSPGSEHHKDLKSFLEHAERKKLKTNSNVYKGTLFEYTVAETMKAFGFELTRTGKSNDLGIDLLGRWRLPEKPYEMRVLIQCKATKPTPAALREIEGAYLGAPTAWQGDNVLAMLVSTKPSTKGVVAAVQRSTSPIGVAQIDSDGSVRQLLWNATAEERGLAGLGVTVRYNDRQSTEDSSLQQAQTLAPKSDVNETVILTWKGNPLHFQ